MHLTSDSSAPCCPAAAARELSMNMLNYIQGLVLRYLAEVSWRDIFSLYARFLSNLRTHLKNRHRGADERELTFARLAERCGKSEFCAAGRVESYYVLFTDNICRNLPDLLIDERLFSDASSHLFNQVCPSVRPLVGNALPMRQSRGRIVNCLVLLIN